MEAQQYLLLADRCLERAATWLEDFDPDEVDYSTPDGVVRMEFADGVQFILNRQAGANQMWYAAGVRAWHYDWDADTERWLDDRDGHELFTNIARTVGEKLGRPLQPAG
ncbi:MAG: iron donor protein CyaY [Planctomycetota bacterium]